MPDSIDRRALLLLVLVAVAEAGPAPDDPITIFVGPGKAVTVTVPDFSKEQLTSITANIFLRDNRAGKAKFESVLAQASSLTLILKTRDALALLMLLIGLTTSLVSRPRGRHDEWDPFSTMLTCAMMFAFLWSILPLLMGFFSGGLLGSLAAWMAKN